MHIILLYCPLRLKYIYTFLLKDASSSEVKAEKLFYLDMHLHQLRSNLKAWSALEKLIVCVV